MLSLEEARALLANRVTPLPSITLPLTRALGYRLASPLVADVDSPPADVSAMDGYAVRAEDLAAGAPLPLAFKIQAGDAPGRLPERHAARIFTGAALPSGADTVVPQEQATAGDDDTVTLECLEKGRHVRGQGEVYHTGDKLVPAGRMLTPPRIAVAASVGAAEVGVFPRPRVAVVSTGSELVGVDAKPERGQIRDSNSSMLSALARASGHEVTGVWRVRDDFDQHISQLTAAATNTDVVVTIGGVSVGDFDLVPRAVEAIGGEIVFHRLKMKPGKPILVARLEGGWLVGLPGNPVSALVGWRLFARPLADALGGAPNAFDEEPMQVEIDAPIPNRGPRTLFHPCRLELRDGALSAHVIGWQGSHDLVAAAEANGLARVEGRSTAAAGECVAFYPLFSGLDGGSAHDG